MLKLADKEIKTVILTVFHMFYNLCRDMEDVKKNTHIKLLEMKTTEFEVKNSQYEINDRLDIEKIKNSMVEQ